MSLNGTVRLINGNLKTAIQGVGAGGTWASKSIGM